MPDIDYGEKKIEIPNEDGTTTIFTNGYYKGPLSIKEQTREDIKTSKQFLLKDVIACLDVLSKTNTPDLTIYIKRDSEGRPFLIQKTWTITKKKV